MAMMSSTVLPNVALSKPPSVCPTRSASSSVAKPSNAASGMMAANETQKVAVSLTPEKWHAKETGMLEEGQIYQD